MVAHKLGISRSAAQRIILGGHVMVNGVAVLKSGMVLGLKERIDIDKAGPDFVGYGGDKLETVFKYFPLNPVGKVCLDVGASTGGFTDCLLKRGAARVYAVENGKNQLAPQLKKDYRVVSMEGRDIRNAVLDWFDCFGGKITFAVADVSFISLTKVIGAINNLLAPGSDIICLIKPQYEVGKGKVSKSGIVKSPMARRLAVERVNTFACSLGLKILGTIPFPEVPLRNKNQEFFVHYKTPKLIELS